MENNSNRQTTDRTEADFDTLFRTYYAPMVLYAIRLTGSQTEAEDVVQDVFCRLLQRAENLSGENLKSLLFTSLHNRILDIKRVSSRHPKSTLLVDATSIATEEESSFEIEMYAQLYREIEQLPRKNREVMRMKMKGMDNDDIAEALGITSETVRSHVKHGIKSLRGKFDDRMLSVVFL